jgi:hypothetical protein
MQASVAVKEKVPGAISFAEDCVGLDRGKLVNFVRESGGEGQESLLRLRVNMAY